MTETRKKPQDRLPSKKKARTRTLWFPTDFEKVAELEALKNQEGLVGMMGDQGKATREAHEAKVANVEKSLRASSIKIVIRSISRKAYERLLTDHPPTQEQLDEFKDSRQKPGFNVETYPIALVVDSIIDPVVPEADLGAWLDSEDWTGGEFTELFTACVSINAESSILSLGKG